MWNSESYQVQPDLLVKETREDMEGVRQKICYLVETKKSECRQAFWRQQQQRHALYILKEFNRVAKEMLLEKNVDEDENNSESGEK